MSRIQPITTEAATAEQNAVLETVRKAMGGVPNLLATMAQSPAVANAYLAFNQALSSGLLSPRLREQIALAVSEANSCKYCLAAHTMLGKGAGLTEKEIIRAREAEAEDAKTAAALAFAVSVVRNRGLVFDEDVAGLREHGYSDGEVVEVVAHVVLSILTNYINHVADTEVDFPAAPELNVA